MRSDPSGFERRAGRVRAEDSLIGGGSAAGPSRLAGRIPKDWKIPLRLWPPINVRRLGSSKTIALDVHLIAASKVDLGLAVQQGKFRRDLYYRIAVVDVEVPPLRDRKEDIPLLSNVFLRSFLTNFAQSEEGEDSWSRLTPALQEELLQYSWPGNLRELRNVLERLQCIGPDGLLLGDSTGAASYESPPPLSFDLNRPFKEAKEELLDAFEREYLENLLLRSSGRVAPAAREAGLNRKYFYDLLRKHGLHGRGQ